jgi:uncharacterized protein
MLAFSLQCSYIVVVDLIRFEWDSYKEKLNLNKHGISFSEAKSAFYDLNALVIHDPQHSSPEEDRFILLGMTTSLKLILVSHCYRSNDEVIRIISARKADSKEKKYYGK